MWTARTHSATPPHFETASAGPAVVYRGSALRMGCLHVRWDSTEHYGAASTIRPQRRDVAPSGLTWNYLSRAAGFALASRRTDNVACSPRRIACNGDSYVSRKAMWFYCRARDTRRTAAMPLFLLESGAPLTRRRLNGVLRDALGEGFSSHSLRIGLATSAAAAGVPDDVIQRLGRWRSTAYDGYGRRQRQAVALALMAVARFST